MNREKFKSALILKNMLFTKLEFTRIGEKNNNEIDFQMEVEIKQVTSEKDYCVSLSVIGKKSNEYDLYVGLDGYFTLEDVDYLNDNQKKSILKRNTVAIMMPYVRSQISLLTAQPGMDCVVLPPFNIAKMMSET